MKNSLKEKIKFFTRILGTEPDTEYMNRVYTQFTLIEFKNGQKTYVFDGAFEGHMLCTADMIGKTKEIVLVMLVLSLERVASEGKSIVPSSKHGDNYFGPILSVNGCIEEIIIQDDPKNAKRWQDAIVDFGVGKILIEIDKKYFHLQLKEGDYIHIIGRVDLRGIE
ncbi:hypothetical protein Metli_2282 [Methanofollis liminatans DSM 4140]|jgi:hypothetical protein|uniref:Uncharacterized protein n=1 Tax=Methanofollis liminatans DSM 4140 TaxID=28892 RepID=J1L5X9_9EURY|nr:hypothetical protein [Methanofollis liminatans]EJG08220.1 hypothetical protein Metli_2282 [Methanofollis liminatans DSM 4140]